jgi:hypothetical protein
MTGPGYSAKVKFDDPVALTRVYATDADAFWAKIEEMFGDEFLSGPLADMHPFADIHPQRIRTCQFCRTPKGREPETMAQCKCGTDDHLRFCHEVQYNIDGVVRERITSMHPTISKANVDSAIKVGNTDFITKVCNGTFTEDDEMKFGDVVKSMSKSSVYVKNIPVFKTFHNNAAQLAYVMAMAGDRGEAALHVTEIVRCIAAHAEKRRKGLRRLASILGLSENLFPVANA